MLVLLAAWVPASSHVFLESIGIVHTLHCQESSPEEHPHHHGHGGESETSELDGHSHSHSEADHTDHNHPDHHDAADGRSLVTSGKYRHIAPEFAPPVWMHIAWVVVLNLDAPCQASTASTSPTGAGPPELLVCWQFSFRTALPARAPSLVS